MVVWLLFHDLQQNYKDEYYENNFISQLSADAVWDKLMEHFWELHHSLHIFKFVSKIVRNKSLVNIQFWTEFSAWVELISGYCVPNRDTLHISFFFCLFFCIDKHKLQSSSLFPTHTLNQWQPFYSCPALYLEHRNVQEMYVELSKFKSWCSMENHLCRCQTQLSFSNWHVLYPGWNLPPEQRQCVLQGVISGVLIKGKCRVDLSQWCGPGWM